MNWQQLVLELGYIPAHEIQLDMVSGDLRYIVTLRDGGKLVFADGPDMETANGF